MTKAAGWIAYALLVAVYLIWGNSPVIGDFGGDNAFYMLTAKYFSPFSPADPVAETYARQSQYPPFYPIVLALTGGAENLAVAHGVTVSALLLGFAALYRWYREISIPPLVATILVAAFAATPGIYFEALLIHSEHLFLCLTAVALWLAARSEHSPAKGLVWGTAIAIALACIVRSAGLSLLAAFWVSLLWRRSPERWVATFLAVVPMAACRLLSPHQASYFHAFLEQLGNDPVANVSTIIATQFHALVGGWIDNFGRLAFGKAILIGLGVLGLVGAAFRAWRGALDGLYTGAYLALLLLWPYPAESMRFMIVILPVLAGQAVWVLIEAARFSRVFVQPAWLGGGLSLVWLLLMMPNLALNAGRFFTPLPAELEAYRRHPDWYQELEPKKALAALRDTYWMETAMHEAAQKIPAGECMYSIKTSILAFHTGRLNKGLLSAKAPDSEFYQDLQKGGCGYVYLLPFASPTYGVPYYPADRLPETKAEIVYVSKPGGEDSFPMGVLLKLKKDGLPEFPAGPENTLPAPH